jgi:multidrug efflux pump subunit AcrA (membrane-fusion protein)
MNFIKTFILFFKNPKILITFLLLVVLLGGSVALFFVLQKHASMSPKTEVMTIKPHPISNKLYFSGTVNPLSKVPMISPVEGVINQIPFQYGTFVKKGDLLFILNSLSQKNDYETSLTDYLKKKQELNASLIKQQNTEVLFNKGLVSKNEYDQDQNSYFLNQLAFKQVKDKLNTFLTKEQIKLFEKLSISDVDEVIKALEEITRDTNIKMIAAQDGVFLAVDQESRKMTVGSEVKKGQVLCYLGDMSGLATTIEINEMNINQIKPGQPIEMTSPLFPQMVLTGYVKQVELQAQASSQQSSVFSAQVIIPHLTEEQQKLLHVGMNIKVAITYEQNKEQLAVPIKSVIRKDDENFLSVLDSKTKTVKQVLVRTGQTTPSEVVIQQGIKAGDQIVISH